MDQQAKDGILNEAQNHVMNVREDIDQSLRIADDQVKKSKEDYRCARSADRVTQMMLIKYGEKRLDELTHLYPSPYFVRCDVLLDDESAVRTIYFSKFPFTDREIYSWAAPIATIRFEPIGDVVYTLPDEQERHGKLLRRDQYMIVDGKIVFLASESSFSPRELVYQHHFSSRKQDFMLPEIVAQMEKAQDQVIRAHHVGPFVISGPAGSGKTTLALHRVAYLVQSPDTMRFYPPESIIVFVQDVGTRKYFSQLLPELGIRDVKITTFAEWAFELLGLRDIGYSDHYGTIEVERDAYEYAKLQALRSGKLPTTSRSPFTSLENMYVDHFDVELKKCFQLQKREQILDRIDLAVLLSAEKVRNSTFETVRTCLVQTRDRKWKKKTERVPTEYSLIVVDEFQNYLPEHLRIIKGCAKSSLHSTVYVGDLSQQVRFGTMRRWEDIGEVVVPDRAVKLHKVYRNTKSILRYIRSLGYEVEIPESMREGVPVEERVVRGTQEEIAYAKKLREKNLDASIGVLARSEQSLALLRQAFVSDTKTHVFTMEESQGVEFDVVCIVGIRRTDWTVPGGDSMAGLSEEKRKILRDLLYVALTRAISELHVLGEEKLNDILYM